MLKENFPITKMYILAFLENGKTYLRVPRSSPRGAEGGLLFRTVQYSAATMYLPIVLSRTNQTISELTSKRSG